MAAGAGADAAREGHRESAGGELKINLIMLGNSAVGKTCLMLRWAKRQFSPSFIVRARGRDGARPTCATPDLRARRERVQTTVGVDCQRKHTEVDGRSVLATVWDTAGQDVRGRDSSRRARRGPRPPAARAPRPSPPLAEVQRYLRLVHSSLRGRLPRVRPHGAWQAPAVTAAPRPPAHSRVLACVRASRTRRASAP
jgi:hypothetical protein